MACGGIGGAHCLPSLVVHGREPIHSFLLGGGLGGGAHCLPRVVQSREPFLHSSLVEASCQTSWTMEMDSAQDSTDVELFDEMHVVEMACGGIGGAHCLPHK
eukprot:1208347-Karenia_brevis.AAC.1